MERARAEARLRVTEERFHSLCHPLIDLDGRLALDGMHLAIADAVLAWAGLSAGNISERKVWDTRW